MAHGVGRSVQSLSLCLLAACSSRAVDECARTYRAARANEAVEACRRALSRTGGVREAASLAYSLYAAGQLDEARALVDRFGTITGVLRLTAAAMDWRAGKLDQASERLSTAAAECRVEGDSVCAARAEIEQGWLALTRGDYRATLEAANRAALEPAARQDPVLKSRALTAVLDVLLAVGDAEGGERVFRAIVDLRADDPARAPFLAVKEGLLQKMRGRKALAAAAYRSTFEAKQDSSAPLAVQWAARLNLLEFALEDHLLDQAATEMKSTEDLWPRVRGRGNADIAYHYYRAWLRREEGQHTQAAQELDQAISLSPRGDWAWMLELERAQNSEAAGQREAALEATHRSIQILEKLRAELGFDELQAWQLQTRRKPFDLQFRLLAESGDSIGALETAESALGRTLLEAFVANRTSDVTVGNTATGQLLVQADALRTLLPALKAGRVLHPRPIRQILELLRGRRILVYFASRETFWRIDIRDGRASVSRLAANRVQLSAAAERLHRDPGDVPLATELGSLLLPGDILEQRALFLVPGDLPPGLPFSVLRVGNKPLFAENTLQYVPNLGTLAALAQEPRRTYGPAVVLADASTDLPHARAEALAVGRLLQVEPRLGSAARREELQREVPPRVLHLALHGGVGPLGSWLRMADGELTSSEVFSVRPRPRLTVLSACASAATRVPDLWGSMSAAFLAAGSQGVLGALWSVDDAETRSFVERFYAEGGAREPASALARTQRSLAERGRPASTWAAFVLLGL